MMNLRPKNRAGVVVWPAILFVTGGAAFVWAADECVISQAVEITPSEQFPNSPFGVAMAFHNGLLAANREVYDAQQRYAGGIVYLFEHDGFAWQEQAAIVRSVAETGAQFGAALAVHDDLLLVGAPFYSTPGQTGSGAAYIFRRSGADWTEEAVLTAPNPQANDRFGAAVAVRGEWAFVSAPHQPGTNPAPGVVHVFRHDVHDWHWHAALSGSQAAWADEFGRSIALSDTWLVVGAPRNGGSPAEAFGAVFVYRLDEGVWNLDAKLTALTDGEVRMLGTSVAVSGDVVLAGAPASLCGTLPGCGAALVFRRAESGWTQEARLSALQPDHYDTQFGGALAIQGDLAVVGRSAGAYEFADGSLAYVYRREAGTWTPLGNLRSPTSAFPSTGRSSIVMEPRGTFLATPHDARNVVYRFELSTADCNGNGALDACDLAAGAADCNVNGIPDECEIADGAAYDCNQDGLLDECPRTFPTLTPTNSQARDFGYAVAVAGDYALVGAPLARPPGVSPFHGAVFGLHRDELGWQIEQVITFPDATAGALLGYDVAIDDNTAVVGAPGFSIDGTRGAGTAVVYRHTNGEWAQEAQLKVEDDSAASANQFGAAVAIDRPFIVVGAPTHDAPLDGVNRVDTGSVFVFEETASGWPMQARLNAENIQGGELFGFAMALDDPWLAVGAPMTHPAASGDPQIQSNGKVFVFRRAVGGYALHSILESPLRRPADAFGAAIALHEGRLLIGAPGEDGACPGNPYCRSGAAYIFSFDGNAWHFEARLADSRPALDDRLGMAVALDGITALVSSRGTTLGTSRPGRVQPFRKADGVWRPMMPLPVAPLGSGMNFGRSLAMENGEVLIGETAGVFEQVGYVHPLTLRPPDCYCPPHEILLREPVDGTVDARQPHPPGDSTRSQGIDGLIVEASPTAAMECWTFCETGRNGTVANIPVTAFPNGNGTTQVRLDRPIAPGAVGVLMYHALDGTYSSASFAHHPGDVNADGWANARDILELVDILNGVRTPRFGNYSADINHSGEVGLSDLTRLIDLLNGAGAYEPWINTKRPAPRWCP